MSEKITHIELVGLDAGTRSTEAEHERIIALNDLLYENVFSLAGNACGPYRVELAIAENRLHFDITGEGKTDPQHIVLPIQPLKSIIRDYFLICESYYAALKENKSHKLESIDMGRRGLHNEGAEQLKSMLEGKVEMDFRTARRLFTLVSVLHMK